MKWFDRWFAQKCKWAWETAQKNRDDSDRPEVRQLVETSDTPWNDGLRINVKKVIGGSVISFRTYDRIKDRSDERHYIITDEQDFNSELGKMITLESMRQS